MIKEIEDEVFNFLKSENAQVLVIKGPWGTGKTFTWSTWLKKAAENGWIPQNQYSYVSLFGCNSLDELKAQVFEQTIPVSMIGVDYTTEALTDRMKEIIAERKGWGLAGVLAGKLNKLVKSLGDIPFIGSTIDISRIGWLTVQKQLICIDDLERIGAELRIKDVYGLVSVLKEQKKCKVVLILNDEYIGGDNKSDYEDHREKVIDTELNFKPAVSELVKLIFPNDHPHFQTLNECITRLKVSNIRTIQKIRTYLEKLDPLLNNADDVYFRNAINSIVLFTVLYFSKPENFPNLEDVLSIDADKMGMMEVSSARRDNDNNAIKKEKTEKFMALKALYNWHGSDEIDQFLGEYVRNGYLDHSKLQKLIDKTSEEGKRIELKNNAKYLYHKASDILWDGLENNIQEVLSAIESSLKANTALYPSIGQLNQYVTILRELDKNTEAKNLILKYISWCEPMDSRFLKLSDVDTYFSGPLDNQVKELIQAKYDEMRAREISQFLQGIDKQKELSEICERASHHRLTNGDYEMLSRFEEEDFMGFLRKKENTRGVREFLKAFIAENPMIANCNSEHENIRAKIISVIRKAASESRLNQFRLRSYLSTIDTQEAQDNARRENATS